MRAARAARSSVGIDGITFRGPPPPEDVVIMSRGKVRDPGPLSPYRLTSTSSRAPGTTVISTMTKKPKCVPKSSAAKKRSRALRTTLDGVGGAGGRGFLSNDVTARFPMPYPGVERGRPPRNATTVVLAAGKAPHQQREKTKSSPEENKGRASHANRETLRAPGTSPGVARKHRKRPRSAILPPSRAEFSRTTTAFPPASSVLLLAKKESGGQVSSSKSKRNNAELSGATSIMPHGRGGLIRGGKKLRPKSAPSRRGGGHEKGKTSAGVGEGGGVLKLLSHMTDARYTTPDELRIMKWVVLRETYLTKLHGVVSAGRKRAAKTTSSKNGPASSDQNNIAKRQPKLFGLLTELLSLLRRITVEIVEAVERWRGVDKGSNRPFIWGSSNYLVKAAGDTAFLSRLPGLEQHLGVVISNNPFLCHVRLDGRPAYPPSTTTEVVAGKGRGKAVGHGSSSHPTCFGASDSLGVSAERLEAAAAVLYREVTRASGGGKGGKNRPHEPAGTNPSEICRPTGSGLIDRPETGNDSRMSQRRRSSMPDDNAAAGDPDPDPPPDRQHPGHFEESSVGSGENQLVNEWRRQVSLEYGTGQENQEDYGVDHDGHAYYGDDRQDDSQEHGFRRGSQDCCDSQKYDQDYYGAPQDNNQDYYDVWQDGQDYRSRPEVSGPTEPEGIDSESHHPPGYHPLVSIKETDSTSPQLVDAVNYPGSVNDPEPSSGVVDGTVLTEGGDPDDPGNGTDGKKGQQRESLFVDVFDMCDGILFNLKGAGLVSQSTKSIYEPSSLVAGVGSKHDHPFLSQARATDDEGSGHMSDTAGENGRHIAADLPTGSQEAHEKEERTGVLRGTAYERQTRNLLAELSADHNSKTGCTVDRSRQEIWNRHTPEELTAKCFAAWIERTEERQLHRELKAARHHRRGQLRRAMSVWDKHRATILGGHMAEAFAGRFGLSTRFFVRYAFDALRAHAKGSRVAARNRAAIGRTREYLEGVGKARLRQAWGRWLQAIEIQDSACKDTLSERNQVASKTGPATVAAGRQGSKEDEWAQWLEDEGSGSCEPPSGNFRGQRAAARGTDPSAAAAAAGSAAGGGKSSDGRQLSPKLSFRRLGDRIKSMGSFRVKGDMAQANRHQQLRSTGARDAHSASSAPPRLDPVTQKLASGVIDAFQAQRGIHGRGAEQEPPHAAASRIQHAWRASREQRIAARITSSASVIQKSWRLRCRRHHAGFQLVRAWRRRSRIRARTLNQALIEAAGQGDLRAVEFLLRPAIGWSVAADANASETGNRSTALHVACRHDYFSAEGGTKKEAKTLARSTQSAQSCDECSLTATVKSNYNPHSDRGRRRDRPNRVGVIRALVEAGAAIEAKNGEGLTAMMTAAGEGCGETVVALATAGAEVDAAESGEGRRPPLVIAAQKSNASSTAALLEYGARVDITAADGLTPLHEAVGEGSIAVAEMLVRAGAKVDAKSESAGMTPLHLAVANNQHAAARLLVHSGANVCLPDDRGLTPLRLTVEMADAPTVALLLAAEPPPDLSVEDQNGGTILHAACRLGLTDIARLLLEAGADPHARNADGKTPELMALDLGHADCAGLFYNMEIHSFAPHKNSQATVAASSARDGSSDADDAKESSNLPRRGGTGAISDAHEREGEGGVRRDDGLDGSESQGEISHQHSNDEETAAAELTIDDAGASHDPVEGGETERGVEKSNHRIARGGSITASRARNKWLSLIDKESGSTYYQNEQSGLTQWEIPPEDGGGEPGTGAEASVAWNSSRPVVRTGKQGLSLIDRNSGSTYYQNEKSGLTQWEVPEVQGGGEVGTGSNNNEDEGSQNPNYDEPLLDGEEGDWSSNAHQYPALGNDGNVLQAMAGDAESETLPKANRKAPSDESGEGPPWQDWGAFGVDETRPDGDGFQRESYSQHQDNDETAARMVMDDAESSRSPLEGETEGGGRTHNITWGGAIAVSRARDKWLSLIDKESGSTYYQNEKSGLTQWEAPEDRERETTTASNKHEEEGRQHPKFEETSPPGGEEGGWTSNAQYPDLGNDDGDLLQAKAEHPETQTHPSRAVSRARNKWLALIDRESGSTYYQNKRSGLTQWEEPLEKGGEAPTGNNQPEEAAEQEGDSNGEEPLPGGGGEGDWRSNPYNLAPDNDGGGDALHAVGIRESGGSTYYQHQLPYSTQWRAPKDEGGELAGTGTEATKEEGSRTAIRERNNTWVSLIDSESGAIYYQNEQSGLAQWDVPTDGMVHPPEAAYGNTMSMA